MWDHEVWPLLFAIRSQNGAKMHLTDLTIPKLRPGVHMDDRTPDFGIRVGKKRRTWIAIVGRGRVKTTLGHYPDLKLSDARTAAKKILAGDVEPRGVKKTFLEARDEFLARHYADKGEGTKYQVSRSLKRHFTALERMQLADIEDRDISRALDKLAHTPSEQLHAFRYLRTFFRWCVRPPRRYLKHSPMEGYEAPGKDRRKSRILSDEEIKAVWYACTERSDAAVRLILLWGTRRQETCVLEQSWAFQGVITIPGEHTKNGRDHTIPINPLAEHVLPTTNHAHYFPGRWGEGHITPRGLSMVVEDVKKRSGTEGWTPHDLRRTFRSLAARVGVSRDMAEMLMNHAPKVLDDIYDRHTYVQEKREALLKIEAAMVWLLARV